MDQSQQVSRIDELFTGPIDLSGKRIVLLLQGGGALGGYQVGAYEALQDHLERIGSKINWVVGISIGAINAAVIAGNRTPDRLSKLESLWKDITWPPAECLSPWAGEYDWWLKACSAICWWSPLAPLVGKYIG